MTDSGEQPVPWEKDWNEDTVRKLYEEARESQRSLMSVPDALDSKIVTIFTLASAIAGFAPKVSTLPPRCSIAWTLWVLALAAWVVSVTFCAVGFFPRDFRFDPDARNVGVPEWFAQSQRDYYVYRLRDMKKSMHHNEGVLKRKVSGLKVAIIATAIEVALLLVAEFAS